MLGVGHTGLADKSAVYIPDPALLPHRVCYMSYFSPHNAPKGSSHLVAEITVPPGDALLSASEDELVGRVAADVSGLCGISQSEIIASQAQRIKHAYVVYDRDYLSNRARVYSVAGRAGPVHLRPLRLLRIPEHGSVPGAGPRSGRGTE